MMLPGDRDHQERLKLLTGLIVVDINLLGLAHISFKCVLFCSMANVS